MIEEEARIADMSAHMKSGGAIGAVLEIEETVIDQLCAMPSQGGENQGLRE